MYDGGIHVAGGIYWKNRIQPVVRDNFVMLMDIFPTVCEVAGVSVSHPVDGISILPLLEGKEQQTDERMVFWVRREGDFRYGGKAYYAARYKEHKLLQNTPWEPLQFFHISQDKTEQNPLSDRTSGIYVKLFEGMMEHIRLSGSVPFQPPLK